MAPLHRQNSQYVFQYSVPLKQSGPTNVIYRSPSAPYRVRSARPTITRTFKQASKPSGHRMKKDGVKRDATPQCQREGTPASAAPSPSPTPPPSPVLPPSTPTHHLGVSSQSRTPDREMHLSASTARKDKASERVHRAGAPVTWSASARGDALTSARNSGGRQRRLPGPPGPGIPLWTRFGIKNNTPVFVHRDRTSSSTDRECVTSYYELFSVEELRTPPDLSDDSQLDEGDIFINTVHSTGLAQMWIWTRDGGKVAYWKVAREGDVREDGRRLSITPTLSLPSWVKPEWCVRQLLKQQQGQ